MKKIKGIKRLIICVFLTFIFLFLAMPFNLDTTQIKLMLENQYLNDVARIDISQKYVWLS